MLVLAIEDVTELRRVHDIEVLFTDKLQESYSRLQNLEKMRDDLTNMMVHDLRTPLISVISGMHMLGEVSELNEIQQEMVGIAIGGGETLLSMINTLLDVEKMESGEMQLDHAALLPGELVTSAVSQVASLAESGGVTLVPQIEPSLPVLRGDADKLRRTLVNLLGNAIKFTPTGGMVTVGVRHRGRGAQPAVSGTRHGRRHSARIVRAYFREVRAGGVAAGRARFEYRPGPDVLQVGGRSAWRQHPCGQHPGTRQHLLLHNPLAVASRLSKYGTFFSSFRKEAVYAFSCFLRRRL